LRIGVMRKAVDKIQKQAPHDGGKLPAAAARTHQGRGLENIAPDDERLLKEIVLFADRSDISEELTPVAKPFPAVRGLPENPRSRSGARWIFWRRK
jgi:uncharacterized protein YicC (UPF0701 family)